MKLFRLVILFLTGVFTISNACGQTANATLNILTLNSGQVNLGGVVELQVSVGNTGPGSILANKVRAQISYPFALVNALPNDQQTGLPTGWTITINNTGTGTITVCNGSDVIPAGTQRQVFIRLLGTALGGPSTINGQLIFSSGASCIVPGTLTGDNIADNTSTTSIQVISTPTPVTLTDFNAALVNCHPVLRWVTETEINSDRFEIERSVTNSSDWVKIGAMAANGNSTTKSEYSFLDRDLTVSSGKVFYRLKMIDLDRSYEYSEVLRVSTDCNTIQVYVYPNPVKDGRLYVSLTGTVGNTEAALLSSSGHVVIRNKINNGTNYLNTSALADGVYILNIKDSNGFDKKVKVIIRN